MAQKTSQSGKAKPPRDNQSQPLKDSRFRVKKLHLIVVGIGLAVVVAILLLLLLRPGSPATSHTDWIDRYYKYLGTILSDTHEYEGNLYISDMAEVHVTFYDIDHWEAPVMAINYKDQRADGEERTEYMMLNDGKPIYLNEPGQYYLKHFYNMLEGLDDYYMSYATDGSVEVCYLPLRDKLKEVSVSEYQGEDICVHTKNTPETVSESFPDYDTGETFTRDYLPINKVFLELDEVYRSFDLTIGMTADELREKYDEVVAKLSEDVKESRTELANIDERVAAAQKKQSEAEQKAATEKVNQGETDQANSQTGAKPNNTGVTNSGDSGSNTGAGGSQANGIMVGGDLIKYGTYMRLDPNDGVSDWGGRLHLYANGTAMLNSSNGTSTSYPSYRSEEYGFTQDGYNITYMPALVFYDSQGRQALIFYYQNGILRDTGSSMYKWIGE